MKLLPSFVLFLNSSFQSYQKNVPNQAETSQFFSYVYYRKWDYPSILKADIQAISPPKCSRNLRTVPYVLNTYYLIEVDSGICSKASHIHRPFVIGMALVNTGVSLKKRPKKALENITKSLLYALIIFHIHNCKIKRTPFLLAMKRRSKIIDLSPRYFKIRYTSQNGFLSAVLFLF